MVVRVVCSEDGALEDNASVTAAAAAAEQLHALPSPARIYSYPSARSDAEVDDDRGAQASFDQGAIKGSILKTNTKPEMQISTDNCRSFSEFHG